MNKLIMKYKQLNPEPKSALFALISVVFNGLLGIGKFILAIFKGIFFFVSGVINIFFGFAKLECFWGLKNYKNKAFKYRNIKVATFLLIAGIQYTIYMATLIFNKRSIFEYTQILSIAIALVAFVELGIAIYGMFKIKGKGHYYRDIKFINLCSALTALMWAELALLTFTTGTDNILICGISGVIIGLVIVCVAIYIYFAPKVSLIDQEHNVYKLKTTKHSLQLNENNNVEIVLYKSKVFGDYVYKAKYEDKTLDGHIIKTKNYWHKLDVWWKAFIILFSEILIFAYGFWAIVYFFKNINLLKKLDNKMLKLDFEKVKDLSA